MFKPTFFERVKHKITQRLDLILAKKRKNKLRNTDFSIISNNCWGVFATNILIF